MGYDCTFHLVDEQAIRGEFVPRLLGLSKKPTPLDKVREDAAELWATVRQALEDGTDAEGRKLRPEAVASLVCQLAVIYSACSLPHHYERGLALSLWPEEECGADFPSDLAQSPEPLFAELVKKYPRLKGEFPSFFTGNFSTGVYLPAGKVEPVREWVQETISQLTKGQQRMYRGLLAMLRAAEEKGLAYWEATDLAIPMMSQAPGDLELMSAEYLRKNPGQATSQEKVNLPSGMLQRTGGWGNIHVLSHAIPDTTVVVDVSLWPPSCHVRAQEFCWNADGDARLRWLLVSRAGPGDHHNPVRGRLLADLKSMPDLVLQVDENGKEVQINDGFLVAGRVLLVPEVSSYPVGTNVSPWIQDGQRMIPAPGLPPHEVRDAQFGKAWIVRDVARLADGTEILLWDGDGYEWDGMRFHKVWQLGVTDPYNKLSAIPAGDDGIYFTSERKLFEIHRGRPAVQHVPKWVNIMSMLPGPQGGLLLREGDNDDGDIGKLYFPAEQTFIHIEPERFGDHDLYDFMCWSPTSNRIIVSDSYHLYAAPVESILALPRFDVRTGKKIE